MVPQEPIARPSDLRDISFEDNLSETLSRTPFLIGYTLTIEYIYFLAKQCFRIASYFQTMKQKVLTLIESPRKAKKEAKLAAA